MRTALWPDSHQTHLADIQVFFTQDQIDIIEVYVLDRRDKNLGGFIELNLRNYAEGSDSDQVPFIEGWYIDPDLRRQGWGKQLIITVENWALDHGYSELASDSELENIQSIAAHQALGFTEVERQVCYIKKLKI